MGTIGSRIREKRELKEMTQDELAAKVGYRSRSSINKIEIGQRNLSPQKLQQIASALDTTLEYLVEGKEQKKGLTIKSRITDRPSDKAVKVVFRMDSRMHETISALADLDDRSFEEELERLLSDAVEAEVEAREDMEG